MMQYIKIAIVFIIRLILRIFYVFPIKNKNIFFISFKGKYCCNPKYLFEYIYKYYNDKYQYVWCINDHKVFSNEYKDIIIIKYFSLRYFYYIITSKYIINNNLVEPIIPFRKEQKIINTWHGVAYKKVSALVPLLEKNRRYYIALRNIRSKLLNYYIISPCERFRKDISNDWRISESKFLKIGMPRNDVFYKNNNYKEKIKKYYNVNCEIKIILYAPTYRGTRYNIEDFNYDLPTQDIIKAFSKIFNCEYIMFYRMHHENKNSNIPDEVINASDYPDMQELLCAADILLTDYSSSMWDFSLSYKPCFLYTPDLEKYEREQGFYFPIGEWMFPFAKTKEQLIENIKNFNEEKYIQNVKKHHLDMGSYEKGTACEQFCNFLFSK
jgi:CDP-glycerol glycerophosphotransferase